MLSRCFSYAPVDPCSISSTVARDRLRRAGMLVLALILVTTGSYIRERVAEERSELDWLVMVQVGLSLAGAYLGTQLMRRHSPSGFGTTVLAVYLLAVVASAPFSLVNRGEDSDTMMSVTGRTDVWPYAVKRILEGPISTVFGHGYGASKSALNENNSNASFFAYHAHNTFLEVLLSTGVLGALPFLVLVVYSLTWLVRFSWLLESFSLGFALRAATVVSAILSSTMTESELAIKIAPILVVYLFYVLSLDRQPAFLRASQLQSGE